MRIVPTVPAANKKIAIFTGSYHAFSRGRPCRCTKEASRRSPAAPGDHAPESSLTCSSSTTDLLEPEDPGAANAVDLAAIVVETVVRAGRAISPAKEFLPALRDPHDEERGNRHVFRPRCSPGFRRLAVKSRSSSFSARNADLSRLNGARWRGGGLPFGVIRAKPLTWMRSTSASGIRRRFRAAAAGRQVTRYFRRYVFSWPSPPSRLAAVPRPWLSISNEAGAELRKSSTRSHRVSAQLEFVALTEVGAPDQDQALRFAVKRSNTADQPFATCSSFFFFILREIARSHL